MTEVPEQPANIESHLLSLDTGFPNNPKLPLLVYRHAIRHATKIAASDVKRLLSGNHWAGTWQNGVHPFHHFHSNSHEVLVVCAGRADIQFGGPSGPILSVVARDVTLLPAGTSHKCVEATDDFLVVGAYPVGQEDYDMLRGDPAEQVEAEKRIAAVPLPKADPVYGAEGPLLEYWQAERYRALLECPDS